ncbi:MAG: helix-turn-helix domain-containing protein [Hyphomonadaceae bacterium]|nr:helix-turn-helix domain-containing protein [Hyphomonadaceae bacterium]
MRLFWSMNWPRIVGANIRRLRKDRGATLEDIGDAAELDAGYLGKIERGLENPSLNKLVAIASALGVDLGVFFERPSK